VSEARRQAGACHVSHSSLETGSRPWREVKFAGAGPELGAMKATIPITPPNIHPNIRLPTRLPASPSVLGQNLECLVGR
jgi:hypothetical protein